MLSALAAVCLSSCEKNEVAGADNGAVRFTAAIGHEAVATPKSRAAGTTWDAGDALGIFMVNHGSTTTIAVDAAN